jgi:amidase
MKVLAMDQCVLDYSAENPPVLTVVPGELFQLNTASILTHPEDFPDKTTVPVTGPVYVEGAEPGSALKVDIVKIELTAGKGAIVAMPGKGAFAKQITEPKCKVVTYDGKFVYFSDRIKVMLRPMVGKIGVAPLGKGVNSHAPGPHGGNMDITDITVSSSVYLPIFVEGALLACGDVHAAMGDGESEFSALETEARLTLRCQVLDSMKLKNPLVITDSDVMTVGHGKNLEEACKVALDDMAALLCGKLELKFIDAAMLISIAGDLKINQIVNSFVGARVAIDLSIFPQGSFV